MERKLNLNRSSGAHKDSIEFQETYQISPVDRFSCQGNALSAWLKITAKENPGRDRVGQYPQIWQVNTPKGVHAYLSWKGRVHNEGVTYPSNEYPDYSHEELKRVGKNVTWSVLNSARIGILQEIAERENIDISKEMGELRNIAIDHLYNVFLVTVGPMENDEKIAACNAFDNYLNYFDGEN